MQLGNFVMRRSPVSSLIAAAAVVAALAGSALAEERVRGSEIPTNAYYDNPITPDERDGIASEENVSPNDGEASTPPPSERGIIPTPAPIVPGDSADTTKTTDPTRTAESEADVILDDSKQNEPVTAGEYNRCLSQWDAQTQMTKEQWATSCRSTLGYFPEGSN
jgi:hypothetical protein